MNDLLQKYNDYMRLNISRGQVLFSASVAIVFMMENVPNGKIVVINMQHFANIHIPAINITTMHIPPDNLENFPISGS